MVNSTRFVSVRVLLVLMLTLLFVAVLPVYAADIRVEGDCSLRDAIKSANADDDKGGCDKGEGNDTIILTHDTSPGLGELPTVESNIVLEGRGHKINLPKADAAFKVEDGRLIIRNLRVIYLSRRNRRVMRVEDGRLTLVNVIVENCTVGVLQDKSHTSIQGDSNICDLPADELVTGGDTVDINLTPPPAVQTCAMLKGSFATISATFGLASGVQCQQVGAAGIGIQSVIDAGFMAAVDVWGYVEQGVEICFPQLGSLTFLDAATSPRSVSTIQSYGDGGNTCTHLTRAGTVVLAPGAPTETRAPTAVPAAVTQPVTSTVPGRAEVGCPILATGHLKLKDTPSSEAEIIGYITRGTSMIVVGRVIGWYQVSHGGQTGWVGGKYTAAAANC